MGILEKIYGSTRSPAPPPVVQDPDPLAPVVVTPQVQPTPHPGIMGVLSGLVAPEANSFWANATKYGLSQAKTMQQANAIATEKAQLGLDEARDNAKFHDTALGGAGGIARRDKSGDYSMVVQPPVQDKSTDKERLLEQWKSLPESPLKQLIYRMLLRGDASDVILEKSNARKSEIVTREKNKRFAPKGGGGSSRGLIPSEPPPWAR
jgi:hypothetical protein